MNKVKFKETKIAFSKKCFFDHFFFGDGIVRAAGSDIMQKNSKSIIDIYSLNTIELQFSTIADLLDKNYEPLVEIPKNYQSGKLYLIENSPWLDKIQINEEHEEELMKELEGSNKSIKDLKHYYIGSKKEHVHFLDTEIHYQEEHTYKFEPKEEEYQRIYSSFIRNPEKYQINEMYSWDFPENTKNLYKFYINRDKKYVNLEPHIYYMGLHNSNRDIYFSEKNMLISAHLSSNELMGNSFHDVGHTFIFNNPVFFNRTAKYAYDKDFPEYYWEGLIYEYPNSPLLKYFKGKNYHHFIMPLKLFAFREIVATDYKIVTGVNTI